MINFYLSMVVVSVLLIAFLGFGLKTIVSLKGKLAFATIASIMFGASFYLNPDILNWYQYASSQKALKEAQAILKQPGQLERLKQSLQIQVKNHPEDAKAWFLLGRMLASEEQWDKAHDAVFQAYRLEPNNVKTALFYVETIWHTQGHITPQARHILTNILKQDENQPDALIMLAADANERQCYQSAIGYWQRVLVMLPKDSDMAKAITNAITEAKLKPEHCQ